MKSKSEEHTAEYTAKLLENLRIYLIVRTGESRRWDGESVTVGMVRGESHRWDGEM